MTELEAGLLAHAHMLIATQGEELEDKILSNHNTEEDGSFVDVAFIYDGVLNYIEYNIKTRKFTKIKYKLGVGDYRQIFGDRPFSCYYFDNYETREIEL